MFPTLVHDRQEAVSVSFLHSGDPRWASFRYRAARPAAFLGASMNDPSANVVIFSKPRPEDIDVARQVAEDGRVVVMDICDLHVDRPEYRILGDMANLLTASTEFSASTLGMIWQRRVTVIPDPYEFSECEPHASAATRVLWFGHRSNLHSLRRVEEQLAGYPLTVMSNCEGTKPWSLEELRSELAIADAVVLPTTAPWKSANRAVEAIRSGCFVVAEPHPALVGMPGIWVGRIDEGLAWLGHHAAEANERTKLAQEFVRDRFSIETVGLAWQRLVGRGLLSHA